MLLTPQPVFDAEAVPHAEPLLFFCQFDGQRRVGHGGHRNSHGNFSWIIQRKRNLLSSVPEEYVKAEVEVEVKVEVKVELWRYGKNEVK